MIKNIGCYKTVVLVIFNAQISCKGEKEDYYGYVRYAHEIVPQSD